MRRSKTVPRTFEPKWNQTFIYTPIRQSELSYRTLEVSIWHYDRRSGSELLALTHIPLSQVALNDEPRWYALRVADDATLHELSREVCSVVLQI